MSSSRDMKHYPFLVFACMEGILCLYLVGMEYRQKFEPLIVLIFMLMVARPYLKIWVAPSEVGEEIISMIEFTVIGIILVSLIVGVPYLRELIHLQELKDEAHIVQVEYYKRRLDYENEKNRQSNQIIDENVELQETEKLNGENVE